MIQGTSGPVPVDLQAGMLWSRLLELIKVTCECEPAEILGLNFGFVVLLHV